MSDAFFDEFAEMLRDGGGALPLPDCESGRLAIYRNNVVRSAIEALRSAYPTVNALTGDQFFSPMAKAYWQAQPPRTRSMTLYGADFDNHVRGYAPAATLPYLAAVARLDRAWLEAHHARDAATCQSDRVAAMPPQDLLELAPGLHPSVRILRLDWPVCAIWQAHRAGRPDGASRIEPMTEAVIICRPRSQVISARLDPAAATFLERIGMGDSLGQASAMALGEDPNFEAAGAFSAALATGYLAGEPT